jgi:hypothetical protein
VGGWIDGYMDEWMDGWMDGWLSDGRMYEWVLITDLDLSVVLVEMSLMDG